MGPLIRSMNCECRTTRKNEAKLKSQNLESAFLCTLEKPLHKHEEPYAKTPTAVLCARTCLPTGEWANGSSTAGGRNDPGHRMPA